jgi:hypothetical protein
MVTTISSATFLQDTTLFLRDYLITNISDPLSRTNGFIMTSYPKRVVQYPIITIKSTNAPVKKLAMQSTDSWADINIEIRVWSRNAKEVDSLAQTVIDILRKAQFLAGGTVNANLLGFNVSSMNYITESVGDNSIHSKILNLKYSVILTG